MKKKIKLIIFSLLIFIISKTSVLAINLNDKVTCGQLGMFNRKIPEITSWIVTVAQVVVPVLLIVFGVVDFVKAISSQKEDEIKKGQQTFVKRLITAVIVFFVVAITKLLVSVVHVNKPDSFQIVSCIDCFISNKCRTK